MYHCHLCIYLTGHWNNTFKIIREMLPLGAFKHEFLESDRPKPELASKADLILAGFEDLDIDLREALADLASGKKKACELILLADREQIAGITDHLSDITDIWTMPMGEEEIRFRFLRWQESCKMRRDFWQTSQYLEATINNVPNLVWYKDKNGIHKKVNDSFCRTVNKTKAQVEGQGHAYIWDVEYDDPACIESERQVMSTRKTCVSQEEIQAGGGTRLLTTYKSPLYDLDGSVMGTVGVAIDVTQEKAYEKEILNKNQTLETIFTTLDCGVMRHTIDGTRVLSINKAALKILGYESHEELMEDGFNLVAASVVESDQIKLRKAMQTLQKAGDSVSVEYRVRHKNGDLLHVMGNVKLLQAGRELIYQRFLLDCTAQKLREKKNEQRQMELIQALSIDYDVVCFFDLSTGKGRMLRGSKDEMFEPFRRKSGLSLEESMELYIEGAVYEEDREMLRAAFSSDTLKAGLEERNPYYISYRICEEDEIRYYQMKAVRAGEGKDGQGIVLGIRSVDEEIRSEMEKKDLLESALLQANRASKAKSIFLSNMSHDIRTPMNAIVGFTALAISHIDKKEQVKEYLDKIMTSGNHLLSLINDVLDMSRIESGKIHLDEKPCSLPEILHGVSQKI